MFDKLLCWVVGHHWDDWGWCRRCHRERDCRHSWAGCRCTLCGRSRDQEHTRVGCGCTGCGRAMHSPGESCKCGVCGIQLEHPWGLDTAFGRACERCGTVCTHRQFSTGPVVPRMASNDYGPAYGEWICSCDTCRLCWLDNDDPLNPRLDPYPPGRLYLPLRCQSVEEEAFLRAIQADPTDDLRRKVFADWLEEHGDDRYGEYLRVQVAVSEAVRSGVDPQEFRDRLQQLRPCSIPPGSSGSIGLPVRPMCRPPRRRTPNSIKRSTRSTCSTATAASCTGRGASSHN